jgi:hypothetical protein
MFRKDESGSNTEYVLIKTLSYVNVVQWDEMAFTFFASTG